MGARLLTERRGRTALTIAGVTLGVALFTGSLLTTITATVGFEDFARETSGQADVLATAPGGSLAPMVSPRGGGISGATVDELSALPDVRAALGLLAVPTSFEGPEGATSLRINYRVAAALIGVDLEAAPAVFDLDLAKGRLPVEGAAEIVLPIGVADDLGATVGNSIEVATEDGPRHLVLVGVLSAQGIGRLDRVGFTSLATVRELSSRPGELSQVALRLDDSADPREWVRQHESGVDTDGVVLTAASASLDTFRTQVNTLSGTVMVLGTGLLFTAGFLVYLTLAMSVVERTRLFGTMQALGATPRQVRRVVLVEAVAIGVGGSMLGVAFGVGVAVALRAATGRLLELFGSPELTIPTWALLLSAVVGIATTAVSALVPARRAARTETIAAIQITAADPPLRPGSALTAMLLTLTGAAAMTVGGLGPIGIGLVLVFVGMVRLVPHLVAPIARGLRPAVARLFHAGGRISVQHLIAERTRSAYTLALVMLVMAMTVVVAVAWASFNNSLERQLTAQLGDDLSLTAASTFSDDFVQAVRGVDGVAEVTTAARSTSTFTIDGTSEDIYITGIDPDTYFDVANFLFVEGTAAQLAETFRQGTEAVMIPEGTARRLDLNTGDTIQLATLQGPIQFEIAATAELSGIPASFITSRQAAERLFGARGVEEILVRTQASARPEDVRSRIDDQLAGQGTFIASTSSELKADIRAQIGGGINSFFVLLLLAGVVGAFGLANTMAVSITKRYREIGVLRAIGARRGHVRTMAIAEAVTLVSVAFALAVPLGLALSRPLLAATSEQLGDLTVHYSMPWLIFPILVLIGAAVGIGSAIWPARRAAHLDIDTALRFE